MSSDSNFLQDMARRLAGWDEPEARLRKALDFDHFRLWAQPIVALAPPGGIAMAEALVRLREEEARLLPPGDFLPAFEHYRMMPELDRWVVRHALRRLAEGGRVKRLCINVSGQTLEEAGFVPFVAMQLRMTGLEASALVLEIDENDALDRHAAAVRFATEMKRVGCQLLLDGFARRSISFEPLTALRVDHVKVDGVVVRNIMRSEVAATKLRAIVRVGQVTGVGVIAECAEEPEVLARLAELGVGYAQGFGVGAPQPIDELFAG